MKVTEFGHLLHLYYGEKISDSDVSYLIPNVIRSHESNPDEVGQNRVYSLCAYPQEFSSNDAGDYRISYIEVVNPDGSYAFVGKYRSHKIYKGKYRHAVFTVSTALCTSVFLLMLIYPALIYSAGNIQNFFNSYFDFHTVAFHNIVMFLFILIVALDIHVPAPKGDNKPIIIFVLCFCAVSASMAHILKTNYANYYSCNIPVLEEVRLTIQGVIGVLPTTLLYISIVSALNVGFALMSYQLYRFLRFIINKKAKTAIQ